MFIRSDYLRDLDSSYVMKMFRLAEACTDRFNVETLKCCLIGA